jgi:cyclic-di-GMP phosphodiesterase TipF (flagellum assembly factor)
MRILSHLLLLLLSSGAAILVVWLLPGYVPGIAPVVAIIAGGFAFGLGCLLHLGLAQFLSTRRARQALDGLEEDMAQLVANQQHLAIAIDRLDATVIGLEGQAPQNVDTVVAEVKVLQSLVERLYSARAKETTAAASNAPSPAAGGKPAAPPRKAPAERAAPAAGTAMPPLFGTTGPASAMPISLGQPAPARAPAAKAPRNATPPNLADTPIIDNAGSNSLPMPPIAEGLDEKTILDLVRDGLRENGVELALQPIVSLPQRKRRYYECFSPIRAGADRVLLPEQYIGIAERHGLITAVDNLMLFRCIQMVRRLRKTNTNTGFFLNISHHTLADRDFFQQFINMMSQHVELAPNLIFEFAQRGIESADQAVWADLSRLAQMGFRFSIDQIYSLDIDVAYLSSRHVRFLKFGADTLLSAVAAGQIGDDPGALKRILDSYAIDLVADRIESETVLRELLDLHIDFGQGYLFGEPRLVRGEMAMPGS